jgi:hypothetical protein
MKLQNFFNSLKNHIQTTNHPTLDTTTPWFDWLCYCEICESLGPIPGQPSLHRFMRYNAYLKEIGVK